ncbi:MAG: hypothetical protein AAGD09_03300 [Cyanobacteria bacterium P01_F01_bin.56]
MSEGLRIALYALYLKAKQQLKRVPMATWLLLVVLIADLSWPGYLKFNFLVAKVDLSGVVDAYKHRPEN